MADKTTDKQPAPLSTPAPESAPEPAPEPAPAPKADRRRPACPDCGGPLHVYSGTDNQYKAGQGHCAQCGERKPLG